MIVIALYDYVPLESSQLKFKAGDEIEVIKKDHSGWWDGMLNDQRGWFPSNFVKVKRNALKADERSSGKNADRPQLSSIDLTENISSLNINTPNKSTPTISWTSENGVSDPSANEEMVHLFTELLDDLDIKDFQSVSTNGIYLISSVQNILSGLENDQLHELKGWISTLLLSFSTIIKTGLKNPTDELIDELRMILKGLSEACSDLYKSLSGKGTQSFDSVSKKHYPVSNKLILTDVGDYPSPISAKSSPGIAKADQNFSTANCDGLLFAKRGKVKAGKISSLLIYLKDYQRRDLTFTNSFLATYKLYFSSMDLYHFFKETLNIMRPMNTISLEEGKKLQESTHFQSLFMIFTVMRTWIEHYLQFTTEDSNLIDLLIDLANNHIQKLLPKYGDQLCLILQRRKRNLKLIPVQQECPNPILPNNLNRMRFLGLDPLELARQLSLMYCDQFSKVGAHDLLLTSDRYVCESLKSTLSLSLKVCSWVSYTILLETSLDKRTSLLNHFILIAEKCRLLNNFQTMNDIIRGLKANHVNRLAKTWRALPSKSFKIFRHLSLMVSSKNEYSEYRHVLQTVKSPFFPLLHCHLDDLRAINSDYPTYTELGMINYIKMNMLSDSIHQILSSQSADKYAFIRVAAFHIYLNQCFSDEADEDTKYQLSYSLEPHSQQANLDADQSALKSLQQLGMI